LGKLFLPVVFGQGAGEIFVAAVQGFTIAIFYKRARRGSFSPPLLGQLVTLHKRLTPCVTKTLHESDTPPTGDGRTHRQRILLGKDRPERMPGYQLRQHCLNVGYVAQVLISRLTWVLQNLLPSGTTSLAALHDIGKISPGFASKCAKWLTQQGFGEIFRAWTVCHVLPFALRRNAVRNAPLSGLFADS
jgi:hypothetical protein